MSSISIGNTSVEARHSASEKISGGGSPAFVHSATSGVASCSEATVASLTISSRLRSERPSTCVPRAAEP